MSSTYTAFVGTQRIAAGSLERIAQLARHAAPSASSMLVFNDATGEQLEIDLHGTLADIEARLHQRTSPHGAPSNPATPRTPGRPRLGVAAREVTLLPRHWAWLATQPGGTSVALRKLVEQASRQQDPAQRRRQAQEASYRFMSALAGNLPGFEEALRGLFAGNASAFAQRTQDWPGDIRDYARQLASAAFAD